MAVNEVPPMIAAALASAAIEAASSAGERPILDAREHGGLVQALAAVRAYVEAREIRRLQARPSAARTHVVIAYGQSSIHGTGLDEDSLPKLSIGERYAPIIVLESPHELSGAHLKGVAAILAADVDAWLDESLNGDGTRALAYVYTKKEGAR